MVSSRHRNITLSALIKILIANNPKLKLKITASQTISTGLWIEDDESFSACLYDTKENIASGICPLWVDTIDKAKEDKLAEVPTT